MSPLIGQHPLNIRRAYDGEAQAGKLRPGGAARDSVTVLRAGRDVSCQLMVHAGTHPLALDVKSNRRGARNSRSRPSPSR
jgi:hypothetical protein